MADPINVIRKWKPSAPSKPPCIGQYLYSVDGGRTWMNQVEYQRFKRSLTDETWKNG